MLRPRNLVACGIVALFLAAVSKPWIEVVVNQIVEMTMTPWGVDDAGTPAARQIAAAIRADRHIHAVQQGIDLGRRRRPAEAFDELRLRDPDNGLFDYFVLLERLSPAMRPTSRPADAPELQRLIARCRSAPPARLYASEYWRLALAALKATDRGPRVAVRQADLASTRGNAYFYRPLLRAIANGLLAQAKAWREAGFPSEAAGADAAIVKLFLDLLDEPPRPEVVLLASRQLPPALRSLAEDARAAGWEAARAEALRAAADRVEGLLVAWRQRSPADAVNLLPATEDVVRVPAEHDRVMGSIIAAVLSMSAWPVLAAISLVLAAMSPWAWSGPAVRWRWKGWGPAAAVAIVLAPLLMLTALSLSVTVPATWLFSLASLPVPGWIMRIDPGGLRLVVGGLLAGAPLAGFALLLVGLAARVCLVLPSTPPNGSVSNRALVILLTVAGVVLLVTWPLPALAVPGRPMGVAVLRRLLIRVGLAALVAAIVWLVWGFRRRQRAGVPHGPAATALLAVACWSWAASAVGMFATLGLNQRYDRLHQRAFVAAADDQVAERLGPNWHETYFQGMRPMLAAVGERLERDHAAESRPAGQGPAARSATTGGEE